ncbi:MAG: hypothetical protein JXB23_03570 [Candidatus Aminicenantes bacterium]|nr:hypothetical protein [Candidatus Aminicenantes bacterium]
MPDLMGMKTILRTGLLNSLFQILFLVFLYAVGHSAPLSAGPTLRYVLLAALVLIPSIIWTLFFYLQDRYEHEPIPLIIASFMAGMAAAALGFEPLNRFFFRVQEWIYASLPLFILGSFLVKASITSALFYLVLRYGFLPLKEFNEPADGMFYGAVTGTGFAFVYSFNYLVAHPSFTLYIIGFTATVNVLIYSSVGALMGYILSQIKFGQKNPRIYSLLTIFLGMFFLGVFHLVGELFFVSGIHHAFWLCFISVMIYSLIILSYCTIKMRRLSEKGIHAGRTYKFRFNLPAALLIVLLILISGFVSHQGMLGKKFSSDDPGFSFRYPHSLSTQALPTFAASSLLLNKTTKILFSGENASPAFTMTVKADKWREQSRDFDPLRYLESVQTESILIETMQLSGKKARRIAYSYLEKGRRPEFPFPEFIKVYTDIITLNEDVIVFSYKAASEHFEEGLLLYDRILNSLKWDD